MTRLRLLLKTIRHFRLADLATMLGIAVGTAVLAGSLIVGDSVRYSLRRIVDDRLGDIDHVLVCPHFFPQSLGERLARTEPFAAGCTKAQVWLSTTGNCTDTASQRRAPKVSVFGRGDIKPGECVISRPLAEALAAREGSTVILRMAGGEATPFEVPFDHRGDDIASLRLRVARVARETEMEGAFSFYGSQRPVRNIWAALGELQQALDLRDRANVLLVSAKPGHKGKTGAGQLESALKTAASMADYGLKLVELKGGGLSLQSDRIFLTEPVERAATAAPGRKVQVLAYLANTIKDERNGRECPYSMVAGINTLPDGVIGPDEIVLNRWTADDLKAKAGDSVELTYLVRGTQGLSVPRRARFKLSRIIPTKGIGADRTLVPEFKGVTDAEKMGTWDPPPDFEYRADRIRPIDEDYWDRYRAAPKALISIDAARKLWQTRFGGLTSIRFSGASKEQITKSLLRELSPAAMGLAFRPIRAEQMRGAGGSSDFAQLFIGFSLFLIVSAALFVVLLLRLTIEQRSGQIGILLAQGFTERLVRRLLLAEGLIVLLAGCVVGLAGGALYAGLMMVGLRTLWRDAVGTTLLRLHLSGATLSIGFAAGLCIGGFAVWRGTRSLGATSITALIGGRRGGDSVCPPPGRWARVLPIVVFVAALITIGLGAASNKSSRMAIAFFSGGALVLVALLLGLRAVLASARRRRPQKLRRMSPVGFAVRNAARNLGRSMLTVAILASAYFILFAVGSMKMRGDSVAPGKHGSTGGYALIAEFDIPLPYDIGTERGRKYLGTNDPGDPLWNRVEIVGMRASSGEDVSCRNLYLPSAPKVLSVPEKMIADNAFDFAAPRNGKGNRWELLRTRGADGIPVIADSEAAQWILHKGLGDPITVRDGAGRRETLRLVALLRKSFFQAEVLMGENHFLSLFPNRQGYQTLLIKASRNDADKLKAVLLHDLTDFGPTVETTRERLASFFRIANAYISAFEMLGGLGVVLGSFGFVVVLVRSMVERRNEFALLSALGFRRGSIERLVLAETVFLLVSGVLIGVVSALLATSPQIVKSRGTVSLLSIAAVAATLAVSLTVFITIASWIVRRITPSSLRRE